MTEFDKKKNRIDYTWKFEDIFGVDHKIGDKITSAYTVYSKSYLHENIDTDIHSHEFYEMNIVVDGTGTHTINGKEFETHKGYVYVITPNTRHMLKSKENLSVFHILINNYFIMKYKSELESLSGFYSLFNQNYSQAEGKNFLFLNDEQLEMVMTYCNLLLKEQSADSQHAGIICNNLLLVIITKLSQMISENHSRPDLNNSNEISVVRIMDYLNSHYADKIDIKSLTTINFWSKTSLMKYFKMYSGVTPLKYLYMVRSKKAKEKMDAGFTNITFIANECGFFDASHLNKHFRETFGKTPKQYIKELKLKKD